MDTQNKAWAEDKNKFGYKMLQKMGWSEGKGLGKNEDGATSHVRVKRRRTASGLGRNASNLAIHANAAITDSFNEVLSRLNSGGVVEPKKVCDESESECEIEGGEATVPNAEKSPAPKLRAKANNYFARRKRSKDVSTFSAAQMREIFGGVDIPRVRPTLEGRVKKNESKKKKKSKSKAKRSKVSETVC